SLTDAALSVRAGRLAPQLDFPCVATSRSARREPPPKQPKPRQAMSVFTVIRDTTPIVEIPRGAVVAMGNFDGVHLGHRAVITAALERGRARAAPAWPLPFEPHPRRFFSPNTPQFRLSDETAKLRLLAGTGLSGAVVMTFDKARAGTSAQDFIHYDLIGR